MSRLRKILTIGLIAFAPPVLAQQPEAGRLLVADPALDDSNLARTVVLLLLHDDGTSAGIFLNRPTWVEPGSAFPDISAFETWEGTLFLGGPIAPDQVLTVFEYDGAPPIGARRLRDDVYFSPTPEVWEAIDFRGEMAPRVRIFAGHAQWGAGQLEQEIEAGNWHVIEGATDVIFAEDAGDLWERLRRSAGRFTAALR